jgi:23S rRNA (uridine2552-2'-O)-methyltransferase
MAKKRRQRSKEWYDRHRQDAFVQRARQEGYRSRAAFKLEEIDRRDRLLKPGMRVVDLGAAPGGWAQLASNKIGRQGILVCIDLLPMKPIRGVSIIQADFLDQDAKYKIINALGEQKADLVISDMAPNLSGITVSDQARSLELLHGVLLSCRSLLRPGGDLVVKLFEGEGVADFRQACSRDFVCCNIRKPDASRARSREHYLVAKGFRNEVVVPVEEENS